MNKIDTAILEYTKALRLAKKNIDPLLSTLLMNNLFEKESYLHILKNEENLPKELSAYLEAKSNSGCPQCWVNSNIDSIHPECSQKIARYFDKIDDLMKYGDKLQLAISKQGLLNLDIDKDTLNGK